VSILIEGAENSESAENSERSAIARIEVGTRPWRPTIRYLSQTEVHVYALSIGASVLLSFFPFLIVMLTLIRNVFHFQAAENALVLALGDYFPGNLGEFIIRNLTKVNHGRYQVTSFLLLLFTANGIFEPLEVALNRAWGVEKNRSYLRNQILSLFLILLCGGLALGSVLLTAVNTKFFTVQFGLKEASRDLQGYGDPGNGAFAPFDVLAAAEPARADPARPARGDSGRDRA
jgi:uncharacterized BrkB/YihY/UPF0761 family membrane protein